MKKSVTIFCLLVFALSIATFSGNANAQLISKENIEKSVKNLSDYTIAVAETMPAEQYGSKPNEEIWTFAGQLNHIIEINHRFFLQVLKAPKQAKSFKAEDKATVTANLKENLKSVQDALKNLSMADLQEEIPLWGQQMTRFHALLLFMDHMTHHRGSCVIYLRYKGIKPPNFVGW
ncbi:DinB family protein [candidate division KSB1 bacterium]